MGEENEDIMKAKFECWCSVDDRDILRGRICELEELVKALRRQSEIDFQVKKGLDEKLDKVAADYRALWVEHQKLKNAKANLIESNRGLQSKVAKQANEIKRLTEERSLAMSLFHKSKSDKVELHSVIFDKDQALNKLAEQNKTLRNALDQASKDSENNFERGKVKGMEELWAAMRETLKVGPVKFAEIYGYSSAAGLLACVTPTWFMNKHHEYKEKEAHDIKIGDEVVMISPLGSDDSDYGIVYNITEQADGSKCYHVIGSSTCFVFGDKAITDGSVRKTGDHFEHVPFDYLS